MATAKKPRVAKPKVVKEPPGTPEEQSLARALASSARLRFGSTRLNDKTLKPAQKREIFLEAYGNAAKEMGYKNYMDLPEGTRKFISWMGGRSSQKHAPKQDPRTPEKVNLPSDAEWWREVRSNPNFRHAALHPEDDREAIAALQEADAEAQRRY
jgi:hypothetical protein